MSHFISLERAKQMIALYRNERENILADSAKGQNILAFSESFDRAAFERILAQPGCTGVRIYLGMDESRKVHAIVVGYDESGADILPTAATASLQSTTTTGENDDFEGILEEGTRCPDICPPGSDLNPDQP